MIHADLPAGPFTCRQYDRGEFHELEFFCEPTGCPIAYLQCPASDADANSRQLLAALTVLSDNRFLPF